MTELQYAMVRSFKDGRDVQQVAVAYHVTVPDVHAALREVLRTSWTPRAPARPDLRVDPREQTPLVSRSAIGGGGAVSAPQTAGR